MNDGDIPKLPLPQKCRNPEQLCGAIKQAGADHGIFLAYTKKGYLLFNLCSEEFEDGLNIGQINLLLDTVKLSIVSGSMETD